MSLIKKGVQLLDPVGNIFGEEVEVFFFKNERNKTSIKIRGTSWKSNSLLKSVSFLWLVR